MVITTSEMELPLTVQVDLLLVQFIFVQSLFVQSQPNLIGLDEMDWTKMPWTKGRWTKAGRTHCTTECLQFLEEHFPDRIISRRTSRPWPAHSPDPPLLIFVCGEKLMPLSNIKKPESIAIMKEIVHNCTRRMDRDKVF